MSAYRIVDILLENIDLGDFVKSAGIDIISRWEWNPVYKDAVAVPKPEGCHVFRFKAGVDRDESGSIFFQVYYYGPQKAMHITEFMAFVTDDGTQWDTSEPGGFGQEWSSVKREFWMSPANYDRFREDCQALVRDHLIPLALTPDFHRTPRTALNKPIDAIVKKYMIKGTPRRYQSDYEAPGV